MKINIIVLIRHKVGGDTILSFVVPYSFAIIVGKPTEGKFTSVLSILWTKYRDLRQ